MKRIYFYFFLMILFCPSISWASVNYTSVDFGGTLDVEDRHGGDALILLPYPMQLGSGSFELRPAVPIILSISPGLQ